MPTSVVAVDASLSGELLPPRIGPRRGVAATVLVIAGLAVAGGVAFAMLQSMPREPPRKPIVLAPPPGGAASAAATALSGTAAADPTAIPVFSADSLPRASDTPSATASTPARPAPVWRPAPQPRKKKAIDDGF
jgi:hypothetical protein